MRQRRRYHSSTCFASRLDFTPTLVNKNHSNGRTPSGALSSRTWTRFRRTGASFVKSLFLGGANSTLRQRNPTRARRASRFSPAFC